MLPTPPPGGFVSTLAIKEYSHYLRYVWIAGSQANSVESGESTAKAHDSPQWNQLQLKEKQGV